jgi:hypothetical protein
MRQSGIFRGRRRSVAVVATVAVLVIAAAGAAGYLLLRTVGSPRQTAASHLRGWQQGNPPSHGWFIGYRGDLAFAVLVEGGGLGADSAGPIANAFLRKL